MDTLEDLCSLLVGDISDGMCDLLDNCDSPEFYTHISKLSSGKYGTLSQETIREGFLSRIVGYNIIKENNENKINLHIEFTIPKTALKKDELKNLIWWEMQDVEPKLGLVVDIKETMVTICTSYTYSYDEVMEMYDEKCNDEEGEYTF